MVHVHVPYVQATPVPSSSLPWNLSPLSPLSPLSTPCPYYVGNDDDGDDANDDGDDLSPCPCPYRHHYDRWQETLPAVTLHRLDACVGARFASHHYCPSMSPPIQQVIPIQRRRCRRQV